MSLADLTQYQSELEFWFEAQQVDVIQLDRMVRSTELPGVPRQPLQADTLNGMFKGFIDLAFEYQGRYYVVDYKSNWLGADDGAYTREAMEASMAAHRYDLQYVLYVLALHRQLRLRLPDYDYDRDMGSSLLVHARSRKWCLPSSPCEGVDRATRHLVSWPIPGELRMTVELSSALSGHTATLELLESWCERGWLRDLDRALAQFFIELDPAASPLLILVAALASHQLGQGHVCLDLQATLQHPDLTLSLPPEGEDPEVAELLPSQILAGLSVEAWLQSCSASVLFEGDCAPLVLIGPCMYMRRYRDYEQQVATSIARRMRLPADAPADLAARLSTLFPEPFLLDGERKTDWQKVACALAARTFHSHHGRARYREDHHSSSAHCLAAGVSACCGRTVASEFGRTNW